MENVAKMTFDKLKLKVGFGLAVVIYENKLSAEFFKKLSFDQWLQVWKKAPADGEIQKTALEKMKGFEQTFEQWLQVWRNAPAGSESEIQKTALEKMKGSAQTFDQWLQVWEKAPVDGEIQKTALEKMKGLI